MLIRTWFVVFLYCTASLPGQLASQCNFEVNLPVPDLDIIEFPFLVSGLEQDSLNDPFQGICSISLSFQHEYLGDLLIEMISPAGQVVQLIGPSTGSINPTNLSGWEISFVPCAEPASPDPGFSPVFSNEQDWQILSQYTGTYYPHSGCLEDLDTGSANGTWRIRITDSGLNATGILESFEIEFCDDTGLGCAACEAYAGTLTAAEQTICTGDLLEESNFIPVYNPGTEPDPSLYIYTYLLRRAGQLVDIGPVSAFQFTDSGQYEVCGLSVAISDTAVLSNLADTASLATFLDIVEGIDPALCADLTDLCIPVNVETEGSPTLANETICLGDTLYYNGQAYHEPGIYEVRFPRSAGCDSVVTLDLEVNTLRAVIDPAGLINCATPDLLLAGSALNAMGTVTYSWFSPDGIILTDPGMDTIRVGTRERYYLAVADDFCADTTLVDIQGDESYPVVLGTDAVIDCSSPAAEVSVVALPENVDFSWRDDNGFEVGTTAQLQLTLPGKYVVEATDRNGCASVDTVLISIDTIRPDAGISFIRKNCATGETVLRGEPASVAITYRWSGPGMFSSSSRVIIVSDPGLYILEVTGENGCSATDSIFHDGDFQLPAVDAFVSDSLGCGTSGVELSGIAMPAGGTFAWTGPQGFSSGQMVTTAFAAGSYVLTYTALNSCTQADTVEVIRKVEVFDFQVVSDTISCRKDSALITVVGDDLSIEWVDAADSVAFFPSLKVYNVGTYSAILLDTITGCEQIAEVEVSGDLRPPSYSLITDTITCSNPVGQFAIQPTGPTVVDQIVWTFPDQSILIDSILQTAVPGSYRVTVRDENGCERSSAFMPVFDTIAPVVYLSTPVLGCVDSVMISTISIDPAILYQWNGPGNFSSVASQPFVTGAGSYALLSTARNGCSRMDTTEVIEDKDPPVFTISGGTLSCTEPVTELVPDFGGQMVDFFWYLGSDTLSTDTVLTITRPGTYALSVTGENLCTGTDSFFVDGPQFPRILLQTDTITCAMPAAQLTATNAAGPATFAWLDSDGLVLSTDSVYSAGALDSIRLVLTGENGCQADTTFLIPSDTVAPVAAIEQLDEILCLQRTVRLDGSSSTAVDPLFAWGTTDGMIIGSNAEPILFAEDTGEYFLILTDLVNGCADTAFFILEESPLSIFGLALSIQAPACHGDANAVISVDSVLGGSGSFVYQLNGVKQAASDFPGLLAGTYLIGVEDTSGCYEDTLVSIPEPDPVSITVSGDQVIHIGELALLNIVPDFDSSRIASVQWVPDLVSSPCPACMQNQVAPLQSTTFEVTVTDSSGCLASATHFVQVIERGNVYVPNIFTPNDDGKNDVLRLYSGPGVEFFDFFGIYDRWGNQVFGAELFSISDLPGIAWDGRLEGQQVLPGVYAFILKYELINGETEIKKGDLLLVR